MLRFFSFLLGTFLFLSPVAHAYNGIDLPFQGSDIGVQDFGGQDSVAKNAETNGATNINNAVLAIVQAIRNVVAILAIMWITYSAFQLVNPGSDRSKIDKEKTQLTLGIGGLLLMLIIEPIVRNVLYGGGAGMEAGTTVINSPEATAAGVLQISGLIAWLRTLVGVAVVGIIAFSGAKMVLSYGDEEQLKAQKQVFGWAAAGFILLALNSVLVNTLYGSPQVGSDGKVHVSMNPFQTIAEASGLTAWILGFVALIATTAIVYGGFLMLNPVGEKDAEKGKKIIGQVIAGVVIIMSSYAIVATLIGMKS